MSNEFDKKLMLDNISFLLKDMGKKIGELEAEAGVSTGYLSRTSKDENTKPGIDFIMNVSEALNVSIDSLLKVNMSNYTETERYIISFVEKLIFDTEADKLDWKIESADVLNRQEPEGNGYVEHPLFNYETFFEETEYNFMELISRVVFNSKAFGDHTYINGDCYNLRMKNGALLYLMDVCKSVPDANDISVYAKEIWISSPRRDIQYLCGNKDDSVISNLVERLYSSISENSKHPKIKKDLRYIIDAYMRDDISDDIEELPF